MVSEKLIGEVAGQEVYEYTLKNDNGLEVTCINYGCAITKIMTPDRQGKLENIVLGFADWSAYQENDPYLGVVVGRVAGRIAGGSFALAGASYSLPQNNGNNHLHGGWKGFHKVVWSGEIVEQPEGACVAFSYTSPDGEEGYPGNLTVKVTYTLTNDNEFTIHYQGQGDKPTLFNPTNHTYFNLSGNVQQDITQHVLTLKSSRFAPVNGELLPTGELHEVNGTVFDFRQGRKIRDGILSDHQQNILAGHGYDHPFVLDESGHEEIVLQDENSGRQVIVETTAPAVVLYTGNMLPEGLELAGGVSGKHVGLCLETQILPDAIHHTAFSSCILQPGQVFVSTTKYTFSAR